MTFIIKRRPEEIAMQLYIVPSDALPIYRQIVDQILDAVARGLLGRGQRLPSQRELAERLVISPHTVEKAYGELRRAGLVEVRPGRRRLILGTTAVVVALLLAELAAAEAGLFDVTALIGAGEIYLRKLGTSASGTLAVWGVCAVLFAGGCRLAAAAFRRAELPARAPAAHPTWR